MNEDEAAEAAEAAEVIQIAWRKRIRNDPFYDFTLTPVCSEIEHHIVYNNIVDSFVGIPHCAVCKRQCIMYRCINCEYSLCGACHKDKCGSEEISNRFTYDSIRKSIIKFKKRLIDDKLYSWSVGRAKESDDIYFYNPITNSIIYEYPLSPPPPPSPRDE